MSPDKIDAYFRVLRDVLTYILGMAIILYELLTMSSPNEFWVGTGAVMLGVPPLLRITERNRENKADDKEPK